MLPSALGVADHGTALAELGGPGVSVAVVARIVRTAMSRGAAAGLESRGVGHRGRTEQAPKRPAGG